MPYPLNDTQQEPSEAAWLRECGRLRWCPSPNQAPRPQADDISLLVLHNISLPPGEFGGNWIDDLFCNRLDPEAHPYFAGIAPLKVSAHLLIRRDGGMVQYVSLSQQAWHCGDSSFEGRRGCNQFSLGIELEGVDDAAYDGRQYRTLGRVVKRLLMKYPLITRERIVGHSDIAPGRKSDPGPAFDWSRLSAALAKPDIKRMNER
ncbi:MAG: 1,6-anhydro-N-acetylmuramyl-L-alanine amidase AmpD [Gammaproteobacteria bacterium]|nr:1,6-anhydro-N-acetylmuramyl-L-alanine amidase AmpD [Gammaproteobacteria bacterium]